MKETVRVGAAQVAPVLFDGEATLHKCCATIEEAGSLGLDLLVFPETFFAAYPYWRGAVSVREETELAARMQESALLISGPETLELARVARKANVNCVIGCNELGDLPGSGTLYNSLFFLSRDGAVLGRHRKLMPTHTERAYWGMGDAADLRVFDMDIGCVGGLICYEHHMSLVRAAMAILGEEIHCAAWPGWWAMEQHLGGKRLEPGSQACDIEPAAREYAIENQAFVINANWYLPEDAVPDELKPILKYNLAAGGSSVINPSGLYIQEPVFGKETIVWADIHAKERRLAKAYFDCLGHYSRFDVVSLMIRDEAWTPTGPRKVGIANAGLERLAGRSGPRGHGRAAGDPAGLEKLAGKAVELAERYEVDADRIDAFVRDVVGFVEGQGQ